MHTRASTIYWSFPILSYLARLPKWFGERPGKKAGDPETPEGEEDVKADEDALEDEDVEEVEEVVEEGMFDRPISAEENFHCRRVDFGSWI